MTRMSSANRHSDQNGYDGMKANCTIALSAAIATPTQRMAFHLAHTPKAVTIWTTLTAIRIQPHVLRSLKTYFASPTKNFEFETAATPSMKFSVASIASMMPANDIQPTPE